MLIIFRWQGGILGLPLLDKSFCGLPGAFFLAVYGLDFGRACRQASCAMEKNPVEVSLGRFGGRARVGRTTC